MRRKFKNGNGCVVTVKREGKRRADELALGEDTRVRPKEKKGPKSFSTTHDGPLPRMRRNYHPSGSFR